MTWHAIYETQSGRLVSVGEVVANPLPSGLTDLPLLTEPTDREMWDPPTRAFVPRPAKVLVDRLDDLRDHPSFDDLRTAMASLNASQRATVRAAIGRLLGRQRYRSPSEVPEVL